MTSSVKRRSLLALPTLVAIATATLSCPLFAPRAQAAAGEAAGASRPQRKVESRAAREQFDASGRLIFSPRTGRALFDDSADPQPRTPSPLPATAAPALATEDATAPGALTSDLGLTPGALSREWYRAIFGVGIGATGLGTADIDNDGTVEIVAGAGPFGGWANNYWYVASRQGAGYAHEWVSLPYAAGITSLRVAQVDADAALEVLVASGNTVLIYDGGTRELQGSVPLPVSGALSLSVVDVDADGALELVFVTPSNLYVLDLATGTVELTGAGLGGSDVAVGAVDGDPALEIVVANGTSAGRMVDGQTHAVEWTNASGFGTRVRLADLDGDGLAEIVAGFSWTTGLVVYDGDTRLPKYTVPIFNLASVRLADVEGDGPIEVVYGDAQWGDIHVLDGATGAEKFAIANPEHGVTDIAVADVDGDGVREVLWGAGYTSSGPDHLYVADSVTHLREWENLDVSGPFHGLDHGDVDADGAPELLYAAFESDSGYDDGLFFVHDAVTKALEFQSGPTTGANGTGLWRVRSANVDADPQREIFVTTSSAYSGIIISYDGVSHAEEWRATIPSGITFRSLQIADVDGDGQVEVVAGVNVEHSGAPGVFVYVYDAATGALEWQSPSLLTGFRSLSLLRVANVDADAQPEIVVADFGGALFVLDAVTHTVDLTTGDLGVTALETPDRDGDGRAEILIGTDTGAIRDIDPATGAILSTLGSYGSQVSGLALTDVTGDGVDDYVFASADRLHVASGVTGALAWSSDVLGSNVGAHDSILAADVDGDGNQEVVVNVGVVGLMVFEVPFIDTLPPTTAIAMPLSGATVSGVVTILASASDNVAVTQVEFLIDGILRFTDTSAPYAFPWNTTAYANGPHVLVTRAHDEAGNVGTGAAVIVIVNNAVALIAAYDPILKAPRCGAVGSSCDSGVLLRGRATLGPEPHAPNTIGSTCADGTFGTYHVDESNDRIRISTVDGTAFAPGKTVKVEATVWAWVGYTSDRLDLYSAPSATTPVWTHIGTITPPGAGSRVLSATFVLPVGGLQAVRARFRYQGSALPCGGGGGSYNDHDDLVFAVGP